MEVIIRRSNQMKKAIVTGASSGIGKAICGQLAANGWLVYGIGRSFNQSDDTAGTEHIVCDITDTARTGEVNTAGWLLTYFHR